MTLLDLDVNTMQWVYYLYILMSSVFPKCNEIFYKFLLYIIVMRLFLALFKLLCNHAVLLQCTEMHLICHPPSTT